MTRPSTERLSSVLYISATDIRSVTSNTAPQRLDAVSSGPKTRKLRLSRLSFRRSRMNVPCTCVAEQLTAPRRGTSTAYSRKSGKRRSWSRRPPLVCGLALMRRIPSGASAASSVRRRPCSSNRLLGTIAAHPPLEQRHVVRLLEESGERHLVRAPRPFHSLAVHFARACPALGRA